MAKLKVTLAGLQSQIDEGLRKLGTDLRGPHSNEIWEILDRYLKEPGNHFDQLFEKAGLDRNDVRHLQAVLWTVAAPLYIKDSDWDHIRCVELLSRAAWTREVLGWARQPNLFRDVCSVLVNPRYLGDINRDAINRVLRELDVKTEFWIDDYKDISAAALETRLYKTLSDYTLFMKSDVRSRFSAQEVQMVETALDCLRPEWRDG